ncbi:prenyltransferase/squalene oxidase repeat-containing protein [Thalassospira lucentensis]|uniref:prenyltransferase/squalene oxidase repeat-containing protein n=1 Tax=Thalassospira lucentensis TaxID=168935 RepID=UPI0003B54060|nr:prenyltransferase/squalene oxidase repeat-containing protein [Thalassospira lucentensis]
MDKTHLISIRDRVLRQMADNDFAGADPFDGLESQMFQATGLNRFRLARLLWVQAIKRGPDILRTAARIPKMVNPKTLALLSGAADGVPLCDVKARLLSMQNADGGWGYPFAWQARAFYAAQNQSNAIVTSFVMDGLFAAGVTGDDPVMGRAAGFIEDQLWRDGYFAYVANTDAEIHNASLWAAFALSRVRPGNDKTERAVLRVLDAQRGDGSWAYGTLHHHQFVDGFHTGYVLDLLDRLRRSGMAGLDGAIVRGWAFYRDACFDADGLPRSFSGRDGYLDAHSVAQAMASLCRFGDYAGANRVAQWAVKHLYEERRGLFYAGIGRFGPDRRNYMRWTQSWMVWALSIVIDHMAMTDPFDPHMPLSFKHPDPDRAAKESALRALSEEGFRTLFALTRASASQKRASGEMEALYGLTRGLKTLQRIGGERGIVLQARLTTRASAKAT